MIVILIIYVIVYQNKIQKNKIMNCNKYKLKKVLQTMQCLIILKKIGD